MNLAETAVQLKNGLEVRLRSPQPGEAEVLLRHLRKAFRESYRNMNHRPETFEQMPVEKETKILEEFATGADRFMLSAFSGDRIIGNLGLSGLPGAFNKISASLGMAIESEFQNLGLGRALLIRALQGSREAKFHRVELSVRAFNESGIRLYEKVGFRRFGHKTQAALIDGQYHDEFLYEILL